LDSPARAAAAQAAAELVEPGMTIGLGSGRRRADPAIAQQLEHGPHGTAGAEPDRHSGLDELCSGLGCGGAGGRVQALR